MKNTLARVSVARLLAIPLLIWISGQCYSQDDLRSFSLDNKTAGPKQQRKNVELPGLVIDFKNQCIDLEATICLDNGYLELVACSRGSKEHESLVSLPSRAMHIHTALLLLGARNGNPAIRKEIEGEDSRWVHLPPNGDKVSAYLVFKHKDQARLTERPVSDFVVFAPSEDAPLNKNPNPRSEASKTSVEPGKRKSFPHSFVFAGSQLVTDGKGPKTYLADQSGNLISIATFGDELLCLPGIQSHSNGALLWKVKSDSLPKVGTKIILRLRPANKTTKKK